VAWEALAGERLFKGNNDAECLLKIVGSDKLPAVSSRRPEVSSEIAAVLAQALVRDRTQRIADAAELRAAVVAAWGTLAEPREVAALVERLLGERLAKRREEAEQVSTLKRSVTTDSRSALAMAPPSSETRETERGATPRRRILAVTALLVAAALGAGWMLGRRAPEPVAEVAPSATAPPPAPSPSAAPEPTAVPEAPAPVASSASPAPRRAAIPVRKTEPPPEPSTRAPDRLLGRD
jgi:hypothetical protein